MISLEAQTVNEDEQYIHFFQLQLFLRGNAFKIFHSYFYTMFIVRYKGF